MPNLRRTTLVVPLALLACSGGSSSSAPPPPEVGMVERTDLRDVVPAPSLQPAGITVAHDSGRTYLLDSQFGLFELVNDRFELHTDPAVLYAVTPDSAFTDVAALGGDRFAITAMNDGFLLDANAGTFEQHFCYVPGFLIGFEQQTDAVTYDPVTNRILAQPVTRRPGDVAPMASQVGTFPITGGEGDDWHDLPSSDFQCGGMAVDSAGRLWLGRGSQLHRYDLQGDRLQFATDLSGFAIYEISGLAFDGDQLLVLDGATNTLNRLSFDVGR